MNDAEIEIAMRSFLEDLFEDEPRPSFVLIVARPKETGGSGMHLYSDMEPKQLPALFDACATHALMMALDPPDKLD